MKLFVLLPAVFTFPLAWVIWMSLFQTAILGDFAGVKGVEASIFERVMMGYLGLLLLVALVVTWLWALDLFFAKNPS